MAQHFLLNAAARSLSVAKIIGLSDEQVLDVFARLRWPETAGEPVCPGCGCTICYPCPRSPDRPRWRCKACQGDVSITSGTLFAHHKLPLRTYLHAVAVFCNEVKGKSMLALSRELDVQYKTAFVLAHKLREAMASASKGLRIGGDGKVAEIDGAYFGGHVRPANLAAERVDRRLAENQSGKRQVVVAMRERGGPTLVHVVPAEEAAVPIVPQRIARGTVLHADESPAWNQLQARFPMQRDQPSAGLQHRWRLHQRCGVLLLPPAPWRTGASSPHRRPLPAALRPGSRLAGGRAMRQQRRAGAWGGPPGDAMPAIGRFLRLLATRPRRLAS